MAQAVKPILFIPPMVRAIFVGKSQTRRVVDALSFKDGKNPKWSGYRPVFEYGNFFLAGSDGEPATQQIKAPRQPGDILWVRETWSFWPCWDCDIDCNAARCGLLKGDEGCFVYRAQKSKVPHEDKWRPSIHMPKAAARLFLKVTDVRAEHVQDISEEDAIAEGMDPSIEHPGGVIGQFNDLWNSLNADRGYGWTSNPWVWVYAFERAERPEGWPG